MRRTVEEIARLVGAAVQGDGAAVITGAEVDSRMLREGDLFVALSGERTDGHRFVDAALETAAAALVRTQAELDGPPPGRALLRVEDPLESYQRLAADERRRQEWPLVAITGSVAKTTTKEFLAALLSADRRARASAGNRNSTLGLPAQILRIDEPLDVFVAEMGMSSPGELDTLGGLFPSDLLLYTVIAPAHTEFFPDGFAGVVAAKAELLPHLKDTGTLVYNAADENQRGFPSRTRAETVPYGGDDSPVRLERWQGRGLAGSTFDLVVGDARHPVELALPGRHQAENSVAAAAAAWALGMAPERIAEAASGLTAAEHRGRVSEVEPGATLVDDCYNSSPAAARRMIELLGDTPGRRIAVLGEMYELGAISADAHRELGERTAAVADLLVAVGHDDARALAEGARSAGMSTSRIRVVEDAEAAAELVPGLLRPGDVVLVKASLGVGLARTVEAIVAGGAR